MPPFFLNSTRRLESARTPVVNAINQDKQKMNLKRMPVSPKNLQRCCFHKNTARAENQPGKSGAPAEYAWFLIRPFADIGSFRRFLGNTWSTDSQIDCIALASFAHTRRLHLGRCADNH